MVKKSENPTSEQVIHRLKLFQADRQTDNVPAAAFACVVSATTAAASRSVLFTIRKRNPLTH